MNTTLISSALVAYAVAGSLVAAPSPQDARRSSGPEFAAPVRLESGEGLAGRKRLYPSPVLHDLNGDDLPDLVVGDLAGRVTVALRHADDGAIRYGEPKPLQDDRGKDIKFHNW